MQAAGAVVAEQFRHLLVGPDPPSELMPTANPN